MQSSSIAYILRSRLLYMQIQGSLQSEVKRWLQPKHLDKGGLQCLQTLIHLCDSKFTFKWLTYLEHLDASRLNIKRKNQTWAHPWSSCLCKHSIVSCVTRRLVFHPLNSNDTNATNFRLVSQQSSKLPDFCDYTTTAQRENLRDCRWFNSAIVLEVWCMLKYSFFEWSAEDVTGSNLW